MCIKLKKNIFFYLVISIVFFKCAYFNTFYNAEQSFEKALGIIENSPILDDSKLPSEAVDFLNKTIQNSYIVIENYPDSKYIDEAYLLIGVSLFYKKSYDAALDNLNMIIDSDNRELKEKAILWTAYSFLKKQNFKKTEEHLKSLSLDALDKESLYVYYNIEAEMNQNKGSLTKAYENYILASKITSKKTRKNHIYRKLIKLSGDSNDLLSKTKFVKLLESNIEDANKIKNLKIEWIESKSELGHYDEIITEIDLISSNPIFTSIEAQLMIYKARAYKKSNRLVLAREILNEVTSKFSKKNETSEAYYILASIAMFDDFDLQEAKDYFQKSIDEKSRSEYAKKSRKLKEKINIYQELKEEYLFFQENPDIDSTLFPQDDKNLNLSEPSLNEEVYLDSILFNIGQMLYFDFNQIDSALIQYNHIVEIFPNSQYKKQLLNIINYHENLDSINIYEERNIEIEGLDSLSLKRDQAWNLQDIEATLNYFNSMYTDYNDSIALFNVAYIYDHFFYDLNEAIPLYYKIQKEFLDHPSAKYADDRLVELDNNISALLAENNRKIKFFNAFNLIQNDSLDLAKIMLEDIEASRKMPLYQTIDNLNQYIDEYINMNLEYDENQFSDSIIFHRGKIDYYYFERIDKAVSEFEKIVIQSPNSEYYNQSIWILNKEIDKYKGKNIIYDLVDTSAIYFYNPIKTWDIKKVKDDYEKLNNLYMNFEDKD